MADTPVTTRGAVFGATTSTSATSTTTRGAAGETLPTTSATAITTKGAVGEVEPGIFAPFVGDKVRVKQINMDEPLQLHVVTVAGLPSPFGRAAGQTVFVSDEVGGAQPATSDGVSWRRWTDGVVVS